MRGAFHNLRRVTQKTDWPHPSLGRTLSDKLILCQLVAGKRVDIWLWTSRQGTRKSPDLPNFSSTFSKNFRNVGNDIHLGLN